MYGARIRGKWILASWDGNRQGQVEGERRWWTCRIDSLEPGDKYVVRVRGRNGLGWGKWSWISYPILTTLG